MWAKGKKIALGGKMRKKVEECKRLNIHEAETRELLKAPVEGMRDWL